ncbi:hypothetical protein, partial [Acinetobacter sp. F-1]|uniref:hypothetical protein n=1 Tax=Acinetobacter sp. F-1 TaxID=1796981 RepID=UPI001FD1AF11
PTPRQRQKLDFDILNNSAICFVRFRLSRRYELIIGQFPTGASAFNSQESRLFYFYAPIWFVFIQNIT